MEPVPVHCVEQEYWSIRRQRCQCGGALEILGQALTGRDGKVMDSFSTRCGQCGMPHEFEFDITAYWASRNEMSEKIEKYSKLVSKEDLLPLATSSIGNVLNFISTAADSGDVLALDYLADAIRHARMKMEEQKLEKIR